MKLKNFLGSLAVAAAVAMGTAGAASADPGYIIGEDYGSRVTLRSGPSTQSNSLGYGLVGDDVEIMDMVFNSRDGHYWGEVYFYESGASGFIRADYLAFYEGY